MYLLTSTSFCLRNSEEYFVKLLQEKIKLVESKAQKYATNPGRIHASLVKNGIRSDQVLCKQLRLYGSSGYIVETKRFFYDCYNSGAAGIAVWNAGIASLATLGEGLQAINMFEDIPQSLNKTHATYWNVLLACSHAGETSYAHYLLGRVFKRLGIEPSIELIGTYLGGLARNGELDEAVEYVKSMIYKPNQEIIVSILTPLLLLKNLRSILKHKESLITLRKLLIGNFPKMGCNGNRMLKFRDKGHKEDPEYSM